MFAMSYLNLQMFWPRYVHYYVDTDEPIITVKRGHRTGSARQHSWKKKNHTVKSIKTPIRPVCFLARTTCIRYRRIKSRRINRAEPAQTYAPIKQVDIQSLL